MDRFRVLVADDDIVDQMAFARLVRSADLPIECTWADSVEEARKAIAENAFAAAVLDYWLGDGSALDLLPELDGVPTLIVAGAADPTIVQRVKEAGAIDVLEKDTGPQYEAQLAAAVRGALGLPQPAEAEAASRPSPPGAGGRGTVLRPDAEAARRELCEFANIVSHDLKAPARGMITLVEMLCEEHREALGERGRSCLDLLRRRADRLIALIERVREYALLGRDLAWQPVDLNGLVAEVVARLAPPDTVRIGVEGPLPTVEGDRERLALAFGHLLGNAIKFLDKPRGEIRVTAARAPEGWRLSISDNGPGIESEFFGAIFKPCKTLAPQDMVEGSGMGLALAKKIVELHGGRIWVESRVGQGATFHFTLPPHPSPSPPLGAEGRGEGPRGDGRGV